jgi:hypothetical protein
LSVERPRRVVRFARLSDRRGKAGSIRPHQTPFRTALYGSRLTGVIESIRFVRWRTDRAGASSAEHGHRAPVDTSVVGLASSWAVLRALPAWDGPTLAGQAPPLLG